MKKSAILIALIATLIITGCSQKTTEPKKEAGNKFPEKPIEMIVPFAAGGATDVTARIITNAANKYMPNGQSIVVTNKTGGGGAVGTTDAFNSAPDGYKLLYVSATPMCVAPITSKTLYTHDSFQQIIRIVSYSQVLVVRRDSPWKTFDDWVDYCKKNPDKFTYGTQGTGSSAHLIMEEIAAALDIKVKHVPFAGAAPAQTALLGSHIHGMIGASTDLNLAELKPIVDFGTTRTKGLVDDVPTLVEKGIDIKHDVFSGVAAPKGTPKEIITILHDVFKKAQEDPTAREQLKKAGLEPAYLGPEDFQKEISREFRAYEAVVKKTGLLNK